VGAPEASEEASSWHSDTESAADAPVSGSVRRRRYCGPSSTTSDGRADEAPGAAARAAFSVCIADASARTDAAVSSSTGTSAAPNRIDAEGTATEAEPEPRSTYDVKDDGADARAASDREGK
jgi:hypothetical protein